MSAVTNSKHNSELRLTRYPLKMLVALTVDVYVLLTHRGGVSRFRKLRTDFFFCTARYIAGCEAISGTVDNRTTVHDLRAPNHGV
jgi:hypothetical protein